MADEDAKLVQELRDGERDRKAAARMEQLVALAAGSITLDARTLSASPQEKQAQLKQHAREIALLRNQLEALAWDYGKFWTDKRGHSG